MLNKKPIPKDSYSMIPSMWHSWKDKIIEMVVARGHDWRRERVIVAKKSNMKNPVVMKLFCILTMSMSISSLWYHTIVLQAITNRGNWVNSTQDLHYFLHCMWLCISKLKLNVKNPFNSKHKYFWPIICHHGSWILWNKHPAVICVLLCDDFYKR